MSFSSDNLLKQLDHPEPVHRALNSEAGRETYAFLIKMLGRPELNVNQNVNGVHVLFKMRSFGNREEVLDKFTELATHPKAEVRSEAFKMAVGLVKFSIMSERNPLILSEDQDKNLRGAIQYGLTPKATRLARDFFTS
jgi:hypothetical protein